MKSSKSRRTATRPSPLSQPSGRSPARRKSPASSTAITIPIEPALRRAWEAHRAIVEAASREDAGAFDRKYEAIGEILEHVPPLYLAGGYATAQDFCKRFLGEEERTVRRNVRVAKYASPDEEVRYGTNKIDAALGYIEAKTGGTVKGKLPVKWESLRIPLVKSKNHPRVSFEVATVQQIAEATKALRTTRGTSRARTAPEQKVIERALSKGALKTIRVRYSDGTLTLSGIPATALRDLARALNAIVLPPGQLPA